MFNSLKLKKILPISFFAVALVSGIFLGGYSIYMENVSLTHRAGDHLEDVAESTVELTKEFIEAQKARAVDFSSDGFIKNSLVKLRTNPLSAQVMEDLSNHLIVNKLPLEEDFYEVMVLDINGKIVGTTNPEGVFGIDLSDNHMFFEGEKGSHLMEVFYDEMFKYKGIAVSAPILVNDEVLGVVVIKLLPDNFYKIASRGVVFKETEDIFITNKEKYLITPSRFLKGAGGVLVQKVDTRNVAQCFDENAFGHKEKDESTVFFVDHRGEEAIGTHRKMSEVNWCLVAKIDKNEAIDKPLKAFALKRIIVSLLVIATLSLAGFIIGKHLDKRYEFKTK